MIIQQPLCANNFPSRVVAVQSTKEEDKEKEEEGNKRTKRVREIHLQFYPTKKKEVKREELEEKN